MRKLTIEIMVLTAIGMVLAFIGPFDTFELPLIKRMIYWVALVLVGFPLFRASGTAARWLAEATHIPLTLSMLIAIAIGSVPMTAIVAALFFGMTPDRLVDLSGIGLLYLEVWLLASVITGITHLLFRSDMPTTSQPDNNPVTVPLPDAAPRPDLAPPSSANDEPRLDLPPGFGPVLALNSEDHYVRVIGEGRTTLLLMRLRDAIALMPVDSGIQVHRSWWVAKPAIAQIARSGRTMSIALGDGTIVPVSRDNMDKLKTMASTR